MKKNNQAQKLIDDLRKVESATNDFIRIMAIEAKNHFTNSFTDQGFTDKKLEKWEPRKDDDEPSRAILIKTGDLRKSIKVERKGEGVEVSSDLPYAAIHNYGGEGMAWGKHKFKMPQRKFIGDSQVLIDKLLGILKRKLKQILG